MDGRFLYVNLGYTTNLTRSVSYRSLFSCQSITYDQLVYFVVFVGHQYSGNRVEVSIHGFFFCGELLVLLLVQKVKILYSLPR